MFSFVQDIGKDFGKAMVMLIVLVFLVGVACRSTCSCIPWRVQIVTTQTGGE